MHLIHRHLCAVGSALRAAVRSPVRAAAELAGESVNAVVAVALALLTLAQPAFRETGADWLKGLELSVTFLDRNGRLIGHRGIRHDDTLALDGLPRHLVDAVIATEDRRFFTHHGIDPVGIGRALVANAEADGVVQGGSTITQQLAKNLFLTSERTIERKIREAFLALWLEAQLTKPEILKLYLDRAYLGAGTFGIAAAAEFYFGKSARDVTLAEAAVLAGLFKAPSRYAPHLGPGAAKARAEAVLDRMVDAGVIARIEADAARHDPAIAVERPERTVPGHYLDWAFRQVQRLAAAGRFGRTTVLVVETPFDPGLQERAEAAMERALDRDGERLRIGEGAFVAMTPDGAVRALVGGRDYEDSQFDRATEALRQPGSSFKPFVYAAAVASLGYRAETPVDDAEICIGRWCPANYGRSFAGRMPLGTALARSVNTVAVRLTVEIGRAAGAMTTVQAARYGRARTIEVARAAGLTTKLYDTPSLPLGASEVTLAELTAAYAAFGSGGLEAVPHAALAVRDLHGRTLYTRERSEPAPRRVLSPRVAGETTYMMTKVVEAGTGKRAALPGQRVAGKTGTSSSYRDAWFIGFTGHLVAGIWLGNDDSSPMRGVTGGALPAATWAEVMGYAHRDLPAVALAGLDMAGRPAWAADAGAPTSGIVELAGPAPEPGRTGASIEIVGRAAAASGPSARPGAIVLVPHGPGRIRTLSAP